MNDHRRTPQQGRTVKRPRPTTPTTAGRSSERKPTTRKEKQP
nr:MAG TPA: hypothetical protein [Caudoviricetes sp.]